ncbi:MAG: NYN domain-containing protein [Cellulosilyticaceae bacterium]
MKKLVIGILAHVDAGKTTLSEGMLYVSGKIRTLGRVDNKNAYLDTFELERARGITIFSKQATLDLGTVHLTLLDTPGHVDFSAEMERTLQVLDYAILVISGADGVQGHTQTLWRLLKLYKIPVFLFINKMDQKGTDRERLLADLNQNLDERCIAFDTEHTEEFYEQIALCDEHLMEHYLSNNIIEDKLLMEGIRERHVFPCFFGSALKLDGVESFMKCIEAYTVMPTYSEETFGAKVFKIGRDEQGNRLTYMKITGGRLKIRDTIITPEWEAKVTQIRCYSGAKFEAVTEAGAGTICSVAGLTRTKAGEGVGSEQSSHKPILEPVLSYQIILPEGCDPRVALPKLKQLEEEEPELHIVWNEALQEIQAQIMGAVQLEILQSMIQSRFDMSVSFDSGKIVYKETILKTVEGVGHFEPLRHYAEVQLLLEPSEAGSGVTFETDCSEDLLEKNWQRLILTHLEEKEHKGVLIGAPITDMKITLVNGRAHKKHTEGGDFREATYRAVRQGLKQAQSILLEPYYQFKIELPEQMIGRAMTDIEKMHGTCEILQSDSQYSILVGSAPVSTMQNYQKEVIAYTKGHGRMFCTLKGYEHCHNAQEVILEKGYDSERDIENPTSSVFCAHGSGFVVNWDEVKNYMHLESYLKASRGEVPREQYHAQLPEHDEPVIGLEEIDQILNKTYYANQGEKSAWKKRKSAHESYYNVREPQVRPYVNREKYLLVDGYNVIFAWQELRELAEENMDGAKIQLLEALCNYQGAKKNQIIVVFDAYRVQGHREEVSKYNNIHVVYTKEAQTADEYIEKFTHIHHKKYDMIVATSDGLQQVIIRGNGCGLLSARELKADMELVTQQMLENYQARQIPTKTYLGDTLSHGLRAQFNEFITGEIE